MTRRIAIISVLSFLLLFEITLAEENPPVNPQTSAVMSNNCSPEKIKELGDDAVIKINPTPHNPGTNYTSYNVTLDTNKMDFGALIKKMLEAGCF